MLKANKIFFGFFTLLLGSNVFAQNPAVTIIFKADQSVTEQITITFARQTLTLPPFASPTGNTVTFKPGLTDPGTGYFLDANARKSGASSLPYAFKVTFNPTVTMIVSINPALPLAQQITFKPDSGNLEVRRPGL